jgi:hypothetical protein
MKHILSYEGNLEEDLGMNFTIQVDNWGEKEDRELKPNGAQIPVTNKNR